MNNTMKKVRQNPFSLVENNPTFTETKQVIVPSATLDESDCKLRTFRIEVKTSDAQSLHYPIRSTDKMDARAQANKLVSEMAFAFQDERIIWRLAGDRNWTFHGAIKEKKGLLRKIAEYFFILDEEKQVEHAEN